MTTQLFETGLIPSANKQVCLKALTGPCQGQLLEVTSTKFFIGRDPSCQLRPDIPDLGPVHAEISTRDGLVYVRDLDTAAGTTVSGRLLRAKECEAFDGEEIRIGPMSLGLVIGSPGELGDVLPEPPPGWPLTEPSSKAVPSEEPAPPPTPNPADYPTGEQFGKDGALSYEVLGNVLRVTPVQADYNDELTVAPLRADFLSLLEQPLPRRVVVDLGAVRFLSSRAVGVLLAHYQGLTRLGGAMRVCRTHPKVMPVLKQMRLDQWIDAYPTLEEAVRDAWD
jgi:anti-anti-sigma factor